MRQTTKQVAEFANLICRFGDQAVMLDYFEDIVRPAFLGSSTRLFRAYGQTKYFFHNVRVLILSDPNAGEIPVIAGRIVKDTEIKSVQVYKKGTLKPQNRAISTAPSSFFLLILHSHRLVFVKEMAGAPNLEQFALLLQDNIRSMWHDFIRSDRDWSVLLGEDADTVKNKQRLIPRPFVEAVPFSSDDSIESQVNKFSVLRQIRIDFKGTNHEIDNSAFFNKWHHMFDKLDAEEASINFKSQDGLEIANAKEEVRDATAGGMQRVQLIGRDAQGGKLKIDERDFQLNRPLYKKVGKQVPSAARKLYEKFLQAVKDGAIKATVLTEEVRAKIKDIKP